MLQVVWRTSLIRTTNFGQDIKYFFNGKGKIMKKLFIIVIIIMALPSHSFGEWLNGVTDDGESYYAATMNDSGNILGLYCYPASDNCIWLLGMSTACKEGDQYLVLSNSDKGSSPITLYCHRKLTNNVYSYAFTDFDLINNIVTKGIRVGFAVPLESDQFKVIRFNLSSSNVELQK